MKDGRSLRVFENRLLRGIFGPKREEVTGEWRKLHNEELKGSEENYIMRSLMICTAHPILFG